MKKAVITMMLMALTLISYNILGVSASHAEGIILQRAGSIIWTVFEAAAAEYQLGEDYPIEDACVAADIFYDDFEEGNLLKWDKLENYNRQGGAIAEDPQNPSNHVFKAYTWGGRDKDIRPRSELSVDNHEELGKDYWYSWRFMIDPNAKHTSASEIIGQWHTKPDFENKETWENWIDGSFTLALGIDPKTAELMFSATQMDIVDLRSGIIAQKGVWHQILWHIRYSTSDDGYVECWVDGDPLLPFNGKDNRIYGVTAYNSSGSYFKIGTYRYNYTSWENPVELAQGESMVYYDDVRIGTRVYSTCRINDMDRVRRIEQRLSPLLSLIAGLGVY